MADQDKTRAADKTGSQRQQATEGARKNVSKGENRGGTNIEQETQNEKKKAATKGS